MYLKGSQVENLFIQYFEYVFLSLQTVQTLMKYRITMVVIVYQSIFLQISKMKRAKRGLESLDDDLRHDSHTGHHTIYVL